MIYWLLAIVTLIILVFHFMTKENWDEYEGRLGKDGAKVFAAVAMILGFVAWPAALVLLGIRMVLKARG